MSACIVSIVNMKGGVGKSTLANALAHSLVDSHGGVLVIDLDPQASVSLMLCGQTRWQGLCQKDCTLDAYLQPFVHGGEPRRFSDCIARHTGNLINETCLDAMVTAPELRHFERDCLHKFTLHGLDQAHLRDRLAKVLGAAIRSVTEHYDWILFDFPPGMSLLAEAAIQVSDLLLVPTIPDQVSRMATDSFFRRVQKTLLKTAGKRRRMHSLINKYDETLPVHRHEMEALRQTHSVLHTVLPYHEDIVRGGKWTDTPCSLADKYGEAIRPIRELASEFHELTGMG